MILLAQELVSRGIPASETEFWLALAERYGLPWMLIFLVLGAVLRHVIKPLIKSHKEMVAVLKKTNEVNTDINKTNSESLIKLTNLFEAETQRIANIEADLDGLRVDFDDHIKKHGEKS